MSKYFLISKILVISKLVLLLSICSCSEQKEVNDILLKVENIVEQQPDSALQLLNTVLFPEDLNKTMYNKYYLLLLQAKDKSYKDITSDTVIFAVKDYYLNKKDIPNAALAAFYCGRIWHELDNIDKTVDAYMEAEKLADKTENYNLKGLIQGNLGILHREHLSYDKAIEFSKNAVVMYDKAKNYRNKIMAMRLIGDCFLLKNNIDSAFYYYNKSLLYADSCKSIDLQLNIKNSMGVAYREQGLYENAKKLFNEALNSTDDSINQATTVLNIAKLYVLTNNLDSVSFFLDKIIALQLDNPKLIRSSYLLRSNIEENNNNYKEALNSYKEFYKYTINIYDNDKNKKILEIQEKYNYEKLKNSKKESELKLQKVLTMLSLALLIVGIIAFIFYREYVKNKRLIMEIEQKTDSLQKLADKFSAENSTFSHLLLDHFGILRKTVSIESLLTETEQKNGKKLIKKFNNIVYGQDKMDWDKMYSLMDNLRDGFYSKLRIKYPQLNETEFRISCLSCETDFSDKEIEIILGTTLNMVRRIRSDLRKKIGMCKGENFLNFFEKNID